MFLKSIGVALVTLSAAVAGPVGIESFNSNIVFPDTLPSSLRSGNLERNSYAYGFVEKTGFTLTQALPVDLIPSAPYPKNYDLTSDANPGFLPAGLKLNSYLIHFDPVGSSNSTIQNPGTVEIVFEEGFHIAGIQLTMLRMGNSSSSQLQIPGVTYETRTSKTYGVELDSGGNNYPDWIHLVDERTIRIRLHSATDNIDQMRILTITPEPGTWLLMGSALAGVVALRRRKGSEGTR